jgi:hypothetical protein
MGLSSSVVDAIKPRAARRAQGSFAGEAAIG